MPRKIVSRGGGIGESKINRDPDAPSVYAALSGLHVNGIPVEDLPEEQVAQLSRQHTDEDIEERNRGKVESAARVTSTYERRKSTATNFDQHVEERRDFRQSATSAEDFEFTPDYMKEQAEKYVPPGMRPAFLSPMHIDRKGLRGNVIVKDENGEPVKMGRMVLGMQPEAKYKARSEYFRAKSAERLSNVEQEHAERQRDYSDER